MENVQIKITKREYSKSQVSLLTRSMLIAGIAFVIIGACSYGFAKLFENMLGTTYTPIGLLICLLTLIASMVISSLWTINMFKSGSWGLTITCYLLYILMTSVAFGWIFSLGFNQQLWWLPVIFAVAGGVFLITFAIAKLMSLRGVVTMGKIIGATAIAMSILMIVFLVIMIVALATQNGGVVLAGDALCSLIMAGMALISFLYIIIDIWRIQKLSQFADEQGIEQTKIMPWLFGFSLLTDLINVVFWMIILFIRLAGRR